MDRTELVKLQSPRIRQPAKKRQNRRGRPAIGLKSSIVLPVWAVEQLEVVRAATEERQGKYYAQAELVRDAIKLGLLAMYEAGVRPEGFDPAKARKLAELRGDPV